MDAIARFEGIPTWTYYGDTSLLDAAVKHYVTNLGKESPDGWRVIEVKDMYNQHKPQERYMASVFGVYIIINKMEGEA